MKGSCLCGAIEYSVAQLDSAIAHCSCLSCRKAHAAAFTSTAAVHRDHFCWLKGEGKLSAYESSPGKFRHFCSQCGSQLVAERAGKPMLILRVATLDQDPLTKPEFHIWKNHEVLWLEYGSQINAYSEWQEGR
ncbi:GFA family protein [Agarivorans sp. DSG3-1]|uniref:GFA family protein n=1 Tax=Agarivorans sp. DSG3-1 TaxID=3342249 RepID=UPI00398F2D9F